jgi:hypothetical protein
LAVAHRLLKRAVMKHASLLTIALGGCAAIPQLSSTTSSGAPSSTIGHDHSGDVDPEHGEVDPNDPGPEVAYLAGVRQPAPDVYIVNMALDPDVPPGSLDPEMGWRSQYCPDRGTVWQAGVVESPVPDLVGKTPADAVAALQPMGRYCVVIEEKHDCTAPGGDGHICEQDTDAGKTIDATNALGLQIQSDVADRGTDHETRRVPVVSGRHAQEVLADLKQRGFTKVKVVDETAGCEPDTVCWADLHEGELYPPHDEIILHVRRTRSH